MPSASATCGARLACASAAAAGGGGAAGAPTCARFSLAGGSRALAVGRWDGAVALCDASAGGAGGAQVVDAATAGAPVLAVAFDATDENVYACGADGGVRVISAGSEAAEATELGAHGDAASCVAPLVDAPSSGAVSGGWDGRLKLWDARHRGEADQCSLPGGGRALSIDSSRGGAQALLAVAASDRRLLTFDARALGAGPLSERASPLKMATRSVRMLGSGGDRLALGSLEGRVAVEYLAEPDSAARSSGTKYKSYAFKCHRVSAEEGGVDDEAGADVAGAPLGKAGDVLTPVHALAAHPLSGALASGDGDGLVAVWDTSAKRRLWLSGAYPHGVCDLDFSADGSALAIVTSSALEGGGGEEGEGGVWVREMAVGEYTPKARK